MRSYRRNELRLWTQWQESNNQQWIWNYFIGFMVWVSLLFFVIYYYSIMFALHLISFIMCFLFSFNFKWCFMNIPMWYAPENGSHPNMYYIHFSLTHTQRAPNYRLTLPLDSACLFNVSRSRPVYSSWDRCAHVNFSSLLIPISYGSQTFQYIPAHINFPTHTHTQWDRENGR